MRIPPTLFMAAAMSILTVGGASAAGDSGTIYIKTSEHKLYHVLPDGEMRVYTVAVGKPGQTWFGTKKVEGKYIKPAWSPPDVVRRDKPSLPKVIAGGSPKNPMGAAALTLTGGEYAIHGTNVPDSIGTSASYGCIRMHNRDILELYSRVRVGTTVVVSE